MMDVIIIITITIITTLIVNYLCIDRPSGCPICESVSDAVGASIALEMTRMSGLIDLRSVNVRNRK